MVEVAVLFLIGQRLAQVVWRNSTPTSFSRTVCLRVWVKALKKNLITRLRLDFQHDPALFFRGGMALFSLCALPKQSDCDNR